jgi:hypothetical protein
MVYNPVPKLLNLLSWLLSHFTQSLRKEILLTYVASNEKLKRGVMAKVMVHKPSQPSYFTYVPFQSNGYSFTLSHSIQRFRFLHQRNSTTLLLLHHRFQIHRRRRRSLRIGISLRWKTLSYPKASQRFCCWRFPIAKIYR